MTTLSFGIKTAPQHTTYAAIQRVWLEADELPAIQHAWLFDHFAPIHSDVSGPCLEGWTLLAALAAQTTRLRLGLMVTGNTYRHPAVLAKMAATVDRISRGHLDLGLGAGWNGYEHQSMGIPLYAPGERIRRLAEACALIKLLFTQDVTDFAGRYYSLRGAGCEPKPVQNPHPPFVIGGAGERLTLRVVAEHADVWNYPNTRGPLDEFQRKLDILHQHCERLGRDPAVIPISVQPTVNYDDLADTVRTVQQVVDAGARHVVLNLRPPFPDGIVRRLAEQVIPAVRAG